MTLQQLKLSAAEIAVDQVLPNEDSISDRHDVLSVSQEHFRGRTPGRFAEVLCGDDRVHFRDLSSTQFRYRTNIPRFPETKIFSHHLSAAISTLRWL